MICVASNFLRELENERFGMKTKQKSALIFRPYHPVLLLNPGQFFSSTQTFLLTVSYRKQSGPHVRLHVLVVERHDLHQVLQRRHAHLSTGRGEGAELQTAQLNRGLVVT